MLLRNKFLNRSTRGNSDQGQSVLIPKILEPLIMERLRGETAIYNPQRNKCIMEMFRHKKTQQRKKDIIIQLEWEIKCQEK